MALYSFDATFGASVPSSLETRPTFVTKTESLKRLSDPERLYEFLLASFLAGSFRTQPSVFEERELSKPVDVGSLRVGQYVVIDGEPCKIVEYEKSKPGI